MVRVAVGGLERSRLRVGTGTEGIERLEAFLVRSAFAAHRHDTYGIGVTLGGVLSFGYRGRRHTCRPGQVCVLHPDEVHDGAPGTGEGVRYRILRVDPAVVQEALGGVRLPFVADPVLEPERAGAPLLDWLLDIDTPLGEAERTEVVCLVADLLAGPGASGGERLALGALRRARDLIASDPAVRHSAAELESAAGLDRWTLARQFRAAFGTSPTRFRTMRQLDLVRRLAAGGTPLSEAATAAGFADQSHMSRMFKRAYGMTPSVWTAASGAARPGPRRPRRPGAEGPPTPGAPPPRLRHSGTGRP
ncbi:AraC family transcriptional regulator [Nocardiopsis sp. FR26]|uniref:AraC family transcriptional regulator n=1 Tax=unclassified Nocardiopsis TaxID=2649073 RepID=UPI00351A6444